MVEISSCSFVQAAVRGNGHVKLQMSGGSAEAFGWGWLERSRGRVKQVGWMVTWLVGWLVGWLLSWYVGLVGMSVGWYVGWLVGYFQLKHPVFLLFPMWESVFFWRGDISSLKISTATYCDSKYVRLVWRAKSWHAVGLAWVLGWCGCTCHFS